jgi:hypothetical protein
MLSKVVQKKSKGHGGARRGAGRPRRLQIPARLSVDFEAEDLDALQQLATAQDRSLASLIREAVRGYLAQHRQKG